MTIRFILGLVFAALVSVALPSANGTREVLRRPSNMTADGPLLAYYARGGGVNGLGQSGPIVGDGQILALRGGTVVRVLAGQLPAPFKGGLASSPRGRFVAYGTDINPAAGISAQTQGLWVVSDNGQTRHQVLLPPRSTQGNTLGIGPIAWSPDQYTLAYSVSYGIDVAVNPQKDRGPGIWLTRFDRPKPRLVATLAQLGLGTEGPPPVTQLSWAPNGRTLAISTARQSWKDGQTIPEVLSLDIETGQAHLLVDGGQYASFSKVDGELTYVTDEGGTTPSMALWVTGAHGQRHKIITVAGIITSPTWSPDGRTIAYVAGSRPVGGVTSIHLVDVATGRDRVTLASDSATQPLFTPGGRFLRLAWMHARI